MKAARTKSHHVLLGSVGFSLVVLDFSLVFMDLNGCHIWVFMDVNMDFNGCSSVFMCKDRF